MSMVVLGSAVVDMPLAYDHMPVDGETARVTKSDMMVGGKGVNQALQLAHLGEDVTLITALGKDPLGQWMKDRLSDAHLTLRVITGSRNTAYAVPIQLPDRHFIFHVPGVNEEVSVSDLQALAYDWLSVDTLILQGELPWDVSLWAASQVVSAGGRVVLNPAPANNLPPALLALASVVTPNESEFSMMIQAPEDEWDDAAVALFAQNPRLEACLVTLGARGLWLFRRQQARIEFPAVPVEVVDPTGAGDAVTAVWTWAVFRQHMSYEAACKLALKAGALVVSRWGAGTALPVKDELLSGWATQ
ncbi:hypothetical protein BXT84_10550 [Sulfobacillus thermotolerans]|uniref:Carbohydrate kinase PfkB domain-containing protein n=1 Tax=Sulfobacillus thermotolerans TaxID=338644 RepID=A0ABM6RSP8_9FIRM|nr:hypothetical protein BXT84_10550 [Sulfobacillus thermotolerans]